MIVVLGGALSRKRRSRAAPSRQTSLMVRFAGGPHKGPAGRAVLSTRLAYNRGGPFSAGGHTAHGRAHPPQLREVRVSTPTQIDQDKLSFAETAMRLSGKSEEEARRLGAVDK